MNLKVSSFAFISLLIAGCGGGGSSQNATSPQPPISQQGAPLYTGLQSKVDISAANAESIVELLIDDLLSAGLDTASSDGQSSVQGDQLVGGCGGSATFSDNRNSSTLVGTLALDFSSYDDCSGTLLDGKITFKVEQWDFFRDDLSRGSIEFINASLSDAEIDLRLQGELSYQYDEDVALEVFSTSSLEILDNQASKQYWFENYSQTTKYQDRRLLTNEIGLSLQGRLYVSDLGYVDIDSNTDLVCVSPNQNDCTTDVVGVGKITLSGNQDSSASFSFLKHDHDDYGSILYLKVDETGGDSIDSEALIHLGEPKADSAPFAFAGEDFAVLYSDTDQVKVSGLLSFDGDGDALSYQWRVENPFSISCQPALRFNGNDFDTQLIDAESATATMITNTYGGYCLQLRVTDEDGRHATDSVFVSFNELNAFDVERQELVADGRYVRLNSMIAFDANQDGQSELFLHHHTGEHGYVFNYAEQGQYDHAATNTFDFNLSRSRHTFADIDADGTTEWLFLEGRGLTSMLVSYSISATGELGEQVELTEVPRADLEWPRVADFNGDGLPDILFHADSGADKDVHIGLQTEQGEFEFVLFDINVAIEKPTTHAISGYTLGDIDGDSTAEFLTLARNGFSGDLFLQVYNLEGQNFVLFDEIQVDDDCNVTDTRRCDVHNFAVEDLDADGQGEIVFALGGWRHGHELFVYQQSDQGLNGTSSLMLDTLDRNSPFFNSEVQEDRPARFADFNSDGRKDMLINVNFDYSLLVFQEANGTFAASVRVPYVSQDALIEDINADGRPDVVMSNGRELLIQQNVLTD
ncbi:VCBS repeat-containing protein [Thalassotalea euphylliae]|uniref:VCBS repeat-containing protein n=1 Tax=Thalassotalea euphylliae TaxID=1655234 RepID=A0A3E0TKK9_9GAMM|nr:VCBS repeat-containing protein [Thalassotalea euphylliae]REL25094.1 VCBS repeat-containing protein [Thalassotalea euphylliae]